jgi:hypothetical protein
LNLDRGSKRWCLSRSDVHFVISDSGPPPPLPLKVERSGGGGGGGGGPEKLVNRRSGRSTSHPFICALFLICERKIIFSLKLRISALCGFSQIFPVFIIMGLDIKPLNLKDMVQPRSSCLFYWDKANYPMF